MLAMGRALMARPRLLLLDEPSMGLAPLLVKTIFRIIEEINSFGTTILLVEQNANMALAIADRGYVIETGRIVMSGPEELVAGALLEATATTLRERTLDEGDGLVVAMTEHGDDVVVRGAALLARAGELGVS